VVTDSIINAIGAWKMGGAPPMTQGPQVPQQPQAPGPEITTTDPNAIPSQAAFFNLYGALIRMCEKKIDPRHMNQQLASACMMNDLDEMFLQIRDRLILATPNLLMMQLEAEVKKMGIADKVAPQLAHAKATLLSPAGSQWFNQVRANLNAAKQREAQEDARGRPAPPPAAPRPQPKPIPTEPGDQTMGGAAAPVAPPQA
jgi:hypothetical protein